MSSTGNVRIRNANSGLVLGVAGMSTADSANVVQFADNGTADHLWTPIPDGPVRIMNQNSGLVIGVAGMSTADSADVVQFQDSGTADHVWTLVDNGSTWMQIFDTPADAARGLLVARDYTKQCFIGRNNHRPNRQAYIMEYWK